jgi:hypothetical protein
MQSIEIPPITKPLTAAKWKERFALGHRKNPRAMESRITIP